MSSSEARDQAAGGTAAEPPGGTAAETSRRAAGDGHGGRSRRRRRWVAVAVVIVIVVVAAGVGAAAAAGAFSSGPATASATSSGYATSTQLVQRESLTSQTEVDATLGDAGAYTVVVPQSSASSSGSSSSASSTAGASSSGTFTWLPQVGQTVRQGHEIYAVSGSPVVLLYGNVPAYRDLYEGLTGADVTELNTDLVKLGYATDAALGPRSGWDYYSAETADAVEQLQAKLGLTETGTLSLGEAVFLPGPVLVTALGTTTAPGAPAAPGTVVLTATSTTPVVTIPLDAGQQSEVKDGDPVSITLPDGSTTPGVVSQISTVASSSSSSSSSNPGAGAAGSGSSGSGATITVLVSLTHPKAAGDLNQAPVTVTITTGSVSNVLVVPVEALLAQTGGGYAVEVTGPHGHHLVPVSVGLFDDAAGLVQVTGNLSPGQRVVVPGI